MARYKKSPMHEGQDKIARFKRLDQLLRSSEGHTLNEILNDDRIDNISKRLLQDNLNELKEKYGAKYKEGLCRGREKLWRYEDTNFSIMEQTSIDMEVIGKSIEKLSFFKGDPRYDMLRFYLIELENGISEDGINFMSFDNNSEVAGLEYIENISDVINLCYPINFLFTTENAPQGVTDCKLASTGRYQHNPDYVLNLLKNAGYQNISHRQLVLRQENGKDVLGTLFVAQLSIDKTVQKL